MQPSDRLLDGATAVAAEQERAGRAVRHVRREPGRHRGAGRAGRRARRPGAAALQPHEPRRAAARDQGRSRWLAHKSRM